MLVTFQHLLPALGHLFTVDVGTVLGLLIFEGNLSSRIDQRLELLTKLPQARKERHPTPSPDVTSETESVTCFRETLE